MTYYVQESDKIHFNFLFYANSQFYPPFVFFKYSGHLLNITVDTWTKKKIYWRSSAPIS